jgi:arabinose-5-phosphate isomerase
MPIELEQKTNFIAAAKKVIDIETRALHSMAQRIAQAFSLACEAILACPGRVIVIGMGKSGHIGRKMAATFASTGTPAFFVHPAEAGHGDMGMITPQDVAVILSNSGETAEVLVLLPFLKRLGIKIIALSGNPNSTLAHAANFHINIAVPEEACPLGLAPTSSTTATLVMGDALAVALLAARGFSQEDFAVSHPGGSLGKRLLLKVKDLMHTDHALPRVKPEVTLQDTLLEMTRARLGITAIVEQQQVVGIFTDGDLRRALEKNIQLTLPIGHLMNPKPHCVSPDILAAEALRMMQTKAINALLVVNAQHELLGALNMHDLLKAGVI